MKRLVLLTALLGVGGSGLFASPLCTSFVNMTAATMEGLGQGGCQFGDKIFYGFTYSYQLQDANGDPFAGDANTPDVTASQVQVLFSNLGSLASQPVISFLATWQVSDGNAGDIRVSYNVSAPLLNAMYASSLTARGDVSNTDPDNDFSSVVSIAETVCCPGGNAASLGINLQAPVTLSGLTPTSDSDIVFYTPSTQISISKDIFISAGTGANQAILHEVDQGLFELTSVPEPLSCFLFGGGLITIGLVRRRQQNLRNR